METGRLSRTVIEARPEGLQRTPPGRWHVGTTKIKLVNGSSSAEGARGMRNVQWARLRLILWVFHSQPPILGD